MSDIIGRHPARTNWSALGLGIDGNTAYGPVIVYALAVSGTNLYVGGNKGVRPEWRLDKVSIFAVFAAVLKFFHQMAWAVE